MNPKVAIIILNWNGWCDTIECLESLYQIEYDNYDVILVDNGSTDKSIKKIKEYSKGEIEIKSDFFKFQKDNKPLEILEFNKKESKHANLKKINEIPSNQKLIIIKNEENFGYAKGNNIGIQFGLLNLNPEYFLLLNNDTVVDSQFLTKLIEKAQSNPKIGVLGPKIYYYNEKTKIQSNGGKINFWIGRSYHLNANKIDMDEENRDLDFLMGAALLFKSSLIENVGFLYSPYFANWEETDWCIKVKKQGFAIYCVKESKIWHKVSKSLSDFNPLRIYLILRNNIIFMRRNAKIWHFPSFLVFYFIFRVPSFIFLGLYKNSIQNSMKIIQMAIKATFDGLIKNYNNVNELLTK